MVPDNWAQPLPETSFEGLIGDVAGNDYGANPMDEPESPDTMQGISHSGPNAAPCPDPAVHNHTNDVEGIDMAINGMAITNTGVYPGCISDESHAQLVYRDYLATNKGAKGGSTNIQGYPIDNAGMRELAQQAFYAILSIDGLTAEQKETTAAKRARDVVWSDQGVELMSWRLLVRQCSSDKVEVGNSLLI